MCTELTKTKELLQNYPQFTSQIYLSNLPLQIYLSNAFWQKMPLWIKQLFFWEVSVFGMKSQMFTEDFQLKA